MKKIQRYGLLLWVFSPLVLAANWLEMQNNVPPLFDEVQVFGFVQPTYTLNRGDTVNLPATATSPVNGATLTIPAGSSSYDGQTALSNLVGPDFEKEEELRVLRTRVGVRGVVPETDERMNYFLLAEIAGKNGLTREDKIVLSDATVTFNYFPGGRIRYLPGARVRLGLGRLPMGEEAMQGIKNMDYINFSAVTAQLLNERFVEAYDVPTGRTTSPSAGVSLTDSSVVGPSGGFRDLGIEVYDWYNEGAWEYAYAVMLSQANGINLNQDLNSGNSDLTTRLQASYVFEGVGPKREDATVFLWRQDGQREFSGSDYGRRRQGLGFTYREDSIRFSGEYIEGEGMILVSTTPPFNDVGAPGFIPTTKVALDRSNTADGYYLETGWEFAPDWELDLRYDELNKLTNSDYDETRFSTWTLGLQHRYSEEMRFTLNYEVRNSEAVHPEARSSNIQAIQGAVGDAIRGSVGDRISAQLTWYF